MTALKKMEEKGINLNTLIGVLTISGMLITSVFFIAPLRTLPDEVSELRKENREISNAQVSQSATMQSLLIVAVDVKELRRDVDKTVSKVETLHWRVNQVEGGKVGPRMRSGAAGYDDEAGEH